jgi:hypothetical protein
MGPCHFAGIVWDMYRKHLHQETGKEAETPGSEIYSIGTANQYAVTVLNMTT